jgi:toxin ParE1/3/4
VRFRVSLQPVAIADVRDARLWYDGQRPGLGADFLTAVEDGLVALETRADLAPAYYRGLRRILLRRFPYKLFYLIEGNRVEVLRVLHGHRDHRSVLAR